jgi:O-antigen/teichoic acid export membrane protein
MVLARMLSPKDFGLIAMATALTNIANAFRDFGLSVATIQRAKTTHEQVSTLFWVNAGAGALTGVCVACLAPAIAWFYREPRLIPITVVLAWTFVLGGLSVQHRALLSRQMHFVALAGVETLSLLAGVVAAVIASLLGAGYWSLVIMQVVTAAADVTWAWLFCRWRPGRPVRDCDLRRMLTFGGDVTAFGLLNYFARNLDNVLIGRYCGSLTLGLYSKAYALLLLPIGQIRVPITQVAIPAMSRIQNEPKRYASYYMKVCLLLGFVTMPLVVLLGVCSRPAVLLLLGPQWEGASRLFQVLALAAFVQPVVSTRGLVLLSLGASRRYLILGLLYTIPIIGSFIIGIHWGAVGVAVAYTAANYVTLFPLQWYSLRSTPVSMAMFLRAISRPVICSVVMVAFILPVHWYLSGGFPILTIVACLVAGLMAYLGCWVLLPGGVNSLRDLYSYFMLMLNREGMDLT